MDSAAVLTKEMCGEIAVDNSTESGRAAYYAVRAIEDGRTVVVERRTIEQVRAEFEAWWADNWLSSVESNGGVFNSAASWLAYIAALRSAGLVRGE